MFVFLIMPFLTTKPYKINTVVIIRVRCKSNESKFILIQNLMESLPRENNPTFPITHIHGARPRKHRLPLCLIIKPSA